MFQSVKVILSDCQNPNCRYVGQPTHEKLCGCSKPPKSRTLSADDLARRGIDGNGRTINRPYDSRQPPMAQPTGQPNNRKPNNNKPRNNNNPNVDTQKLASNMLELTTIVKDLAIDRQRQLQMSTNPQPVVAQPGGSTYADGYTTSNSSLNAEVNSFLTAPPQ